MVNYYSIFDFENKQIGLVASVYEPSISYWNEIIFFGVCILTTTSLILFSMSLYKDCKVKQVEVQESELIDQTLIN